MPRISVIVAAMIMLFPGTGIAQGAADLQPMPQPYYDPAALPLYPGVAPGSENAKQTEAWAIAPNDLVARNVTRPTISPILPVKSVATGAAVIVIPGGGNVVLSMGKEGYDVAHFLADHGIAAFVLKYRVAETPADLSAMRPMAACAVGAPGAAKSPGNAPKSTPPTSPGGPHFGVDDAKQALRWVRAHAAAYSIDPARVGMVGFSAGAGNIWGTLADNDPTAMPNFAAPIYGGVGARPAVPSNPPPLFIAAAADDPVVHNVPGFPIVQQWHDAGGKIELHYYQNGSHGFGALKQGTSSDLFTEELLLWIKINGFLLYN